MDPQQTNQQVCHKSSSSSITIINLYPFFCLRRASIHLKNMHFFILFHQTAKTHQPKKKKTGFNFRYKNSTCTPNKFIKTDFLLGQHTYKHRHVGVREQIWEFQHFTFKSKLKNTKYPDHQIE